MSDIYPEDEEYVNGFRPMRPKRVPIYFTAIHKKQPFMDPADKTKVRTFKRLEDAHILIYNDFVARHCVDGEDIQICDYAILEHRPTYIYNLDDAGWPHPKEEL